MEKKQNKKKKGRRTRLATMYMVRARTGATDGIRALQQSPGGHHSGDRTHLYLAEVLPPVVGSLKAMYCSCAVLPELLAATCICGILRLLHVVFARLLPAT